MTVSTSDKPQKQLFGKLHFQSILLVETGLHIGGGGESLNIGGLDKPVIREPITQHPYLPGSSIKGKLRSILERLLNKPLNRKGSRDTYRYESDDLVDGVTEIDGQYIKFKGARSCEVCRVFGSTGVKCWIEKAVAQQEGMFDDKSEKKQIDGKEYVKVTGRNAPARLIVRDCHLIEESVEKLKKIDTGLYMTEWKFENGLDRVTAAANPRQIERVPAGSLFNFELVYTVENADQVQEDIKNIALAIAILEDDALGGHGSRGYGKIEFQNFELSYHDYRNLTQTPEGGIEVNGAKLSIKGTTEDLLKNFGQVQNLLPGSRA